MNNLFEVREVVDDSLSNNQFLLIIICHALWALNLLFIEPAFTSFEQLVFLGVTSIVSAQAITSNVALQIFNKASATSMNYGFVADICFMGGMYFSAFIYWLKFHSIFSMHGITLIGIEVTLLIMISGKSVGATLKQSRWIQFLWLQFLSFSSTAVFASVLFCFLWQHVK